MALRSCRECGKDVSTEARTCPHCGIPRPAPEHAPPTSQERRTGAIALALLAVVGVGARTVISALSNGPSAPAPVTTFVHALTARAPDSVDGPLWAECLDSLREAAANPERAAIDTSTYRQERTDRTRIISWTQRTV